MSQQTAGTEAPAKPRRGWSTKLSHPSYIVEMCPNCGFPEADGGSCDECGWFRYSENCPHCVKTVSRR